MSEFVRIIDPSGKTIRNDLYNSPPDAASYIIFKDGGLVKAKNGRTGQIEFSDSDTTTVIQSALNALTSGGTVFIKKGRYKLPLRLYINNDYTILTGEEGTILDWTGDDVGVWIKASNVEISHLTFNPTSVLSRVIQGNYDALNDTRNVRIHHCNFIGKEYSAFPYTINAGDCSIERGIDAGAAYGWLIDHNYFYQNGSEAISLSASCEDESLYPQHCIISYNVIYKSSMGIALEKGCKYCICVANVITKIGKNEGIIVRHKGTQYNMVVNNELKDIDYQGIAAQNGSRHNLIAGNTIFNAYIGIMADCEYTKVMGNFIADLDYYGIEIYGRYNWIEGNKIVYADKEGIMISAGSERCNILNNEVYTCHRGIMYNKSGGGTRTVGNLIVDCRLVGIGLDSTSVAATEKKVIKDNVIINFTAEHSTTLAQAASAGDTVITVDSALNFIIGHYIKVGAEDHRISAINYETGEITLEAGLAEDHAVGTVVQTRLTEYGIYVYSGDYHIIERNEFLGDFYRKIGGTLGAHDILRENIGYVTENNGTAIFSGDGTTTDFSLGAHGLAVTDPNKIIVKVTPISTDAIAASPCTGYVDPADNTKIRVKFASPPASGTDNVKIIWEAEVAP